MPHPEGLHMNNKSNPWVFFCLLSLEMLYRRVEIEKQDFRKKFLGGSLVGGNPRWRSEEVKRP
jgi:hypothetical protein